ncbi:(2Fe-2S)-binding protein [Rhodopseudomonas palustris HaA2]|uniref:(2Fe-2S)-binding protein n=1 Tax=Rhodopseudomonas palustris (strain HaA2) TaxID=316058 RepID=Q2IVF0_RHOP2|nr:(2Fe-2S)-binding protein [Rhodopseudomonas palustris]ABD07810.1 (2Fe-2S)-binding protein [Rhodopseudomonas palustris HaA2]
MKTRVEFELNGAPVAAEIEPRLTLGDCIRHELGKTGTHIGCEHGVCGACTIIIDGEAVRSCLTLGVQVAGKSVMTIEGLADGDNLGPLQASFQKHHGLQCGFCTPGFLMTAHALLTREPDADEERIRDVLSGNVCRCTGYLSIVKAVMEARPAYQREQGVGA